MAILFVIPWNSFISDSTDPSKLIGFFYRVAFASSVILCHNKILQSINQSVRQSLLWYRSIIILLLRRINLRTCGKCTNLPTNGIIYNGIIQLPSQIEYFIKRRSVDNNLMAFYYNWSIKCCYRFPRSHKCYFWH